jgi:hypothetical protein
LADLDLIDWTIQEAQHLKVERRESRDLDGAPLLNKLLTVLEREPLGETNTEAPVAQIADAPGMQTTIEEPTVLPSKLSVAALKTESDLPVPTGSSSSIRAEEPKSAFLMAIVAPDIYTARGGSRSGGRCSLGAKGYPGQAIKMVWPVNQHELRRLIEMGLVEMRDDAPVLTDLGTSAII